MNTSENATAAETEDNAPSFSSPPIPHNNKDVAEEARTQQQQQQRLRSVLSSWQRTPSGGGRTGGDGGNNTNTNNNVNSSFFSNSATGGGPSVANAAASGLTAMLNNPRALKEWSDMKAQLEHLLYRHNQLYSKSEKQERNTMDMLDRLEKYESELSRLRVDNGFLSTQLEHVTINLEKEKNTLREYSEQLSYLTRQLKEARKWGANGGNGPGGGVYGGGGSTATTLYWLIVAWIYVPLLHLVKGMWVLVFPIVSTFQNLTLFNSSALEQLLHDRRSRKKLNKKGGIGKNHHHRGGKNGMSKMISRMHHRGSNNIKHNGNYAGDVGIDEDDLLFRDAFSYPYNNNTTTTATGSGSAMKGSTPPQATLNNNSMARRRGGGIGTPGENTAGKAPSVGVSPLDLGNDTTSPTNSSKKPQSSRSYFAQHGKTNSSGGGGQGQDASASLSSPGQVVGNSSGAGGVYAATGIEGRQLPLLSMLQKKSSASPT